MTTLILFAVVAAAAVVLLRRDLRRAVERRRRRVDGVIRFEFDVTEFVAAMARAARAANTAGEAMVKLGRAIDELPCRWCRVLSLLGLSHHAAHYRPRHRAATR